MPLAEFCNVFHLLFTSTNKNPEKENLLSSSNVSADVDPIIHYEKFSINMDARDTKAIVLAIEVEVESKEMKDVLVGISIYFPFIKKFDLVHDNHGGQPSDVVVPWCKAMFGYHVENNHV